MKLRAYLDNNATTGLAPEALAAMIPYLTDIYLNASSIAGEIYGAARPLADAKRALASLFDDEASAGRFFLTSGASEANSWALHSATADRAAGHLISTAIEHPSLLNGLEVKAQQGWAVSLAQPDNNGRVAPSAVAALLRSDTALVSVMFANSETGVLQPVAEIATAVREACPSALVHVDATQAVGRVPLSLLGNLVDADLISISAHKFHGPKGCGALFAAEDVELPALVHGSQQDGYRGGTPDTAAAAGLAEAARLARLGLRNMTHVAALRDKFEQRLAERMPLIRILGSDTDRLPNTSNFLIPGCNAQHLVERLALEGIVIAAGSACTSGDTGPSHVLTAMGVGYENAKSALRVSLSAETKEAELDLALAAIFEHALAPA
jgi:cysteine desulfurase